MTQQPEVKFRIEVRCLRCGYARQANERSCRQCGGPMGERVVKRTPIKEVS